MQEIKDMASRERGGAAESPSAAVAVSPAPGRAWGARTVTTPLGHGLVGPEASRAGTVQEIHGSPSFQETGLTVGGGAWRV